MSNKTATVSVNMSYSGPGGQSVVVPAIVTLPTYSALCTGTIDIPALASKATKYEVPFGSVGTGATCVFVKNNAGQDVSLLYNSAATSTCDVPDGGVAMHASADLPADVPLTKLEVMLPAAQVAAGSVDYWVLGDPV